jgi:Acetyltransferase (GNAT) domain
MQADLDIIIKNSLSQTDKEQLLELWNTEYPSKFSFGTIADFEHYLQKLANANSLLLINSQNMVLGWASTFDRDSEKWFVITLNKTAQGQGWGRKMIDILKQNEPVLNGWVVDHNYDEKADGSMYLSPVQFYKKCGFQILSQQRLEKDQISAVKIKWINSQI